MKHTIDPSQQQSARCVSYTELCKVYDLDGSDPDKLYCYSSDDDDDLELGISPPSSDDEEAGEEDETIATRETHHRRQVSNDSTRKRVHFSQVQVQEYNLTLGDHPWCQGYPVSLSWDHTPAIEYSLVDYERERSANRRLSHLTPLQRRVLISVVSGLSPRDLTRLERERHDQVLKELVGKGPESGFWDEDVSKSNDLTPSEPVRRRSYDAESLEELGGGTDDEDVWPVSRRSQSIAEFSTL